MPQDADKSPDPLAHQVSAEQREQLCHAPIECPPQQVAQDWIDYNGHMNMAYYHVAFDRAVDHFFDLLGVGEAYVKTGGSCFTREVHVNYIQELSLGDPIRITLQLLDWDAKRLHFFQHMYCGDRYLAATSEQLALHVDMQSRRTAAFPAGVQQALEQASQTHYQMAKPEQAGQPMGIRRRR